MVEKLEKLGLLGLSKEQMYGSAYLTAQYLKQYLPQITKARVVGMNSVKIELAKVGIDSVGGEDEVINAKTMEDFLDYEVDSAIGAVIVGLDTKFTY